jgi:hypothetical protein
MMTCTIYPKGKKTVLMMKRMKAMNGNTRQKKEIAKALYNKWRDLYTITVGLLSILEPNEQMPEGYLEYMKKMIRGDAMLVCIKITGSEAGDMYVRCAWRMPA